MPRAIEPSPQNVGAYLNLGIIRGRKDDLEGAVAASRQAVSLDPNCPEGFTNLGIALSNLGQGQAAIEASGRAIELRPDDPMLHYNHAMLLLLAGDLQAGFRGLNGGCRIRRPGFGRDHLMFLGGRESLATAEHC